MFCPKEIDVKTRFSLQRRRPSSLQFSESRHRWCLAVHHAVYSAAPHSSAQRTPRKSSSFLSLRREKDKPEAGPSAYDGAGPSNASPSSYFEVYPRPKTASVSQSLRSRIRRSPSVTQTPPPPSPHASAQTYAFPSLEDDFTPSAAHANGYTRTRSRTGPSKWESSPAAAAVPNLRFSNSSSTQHTETPPRTPDDYTTSSDSLDLFPVVVSAPVPGVETMDALVDGMNGGGGSSINGEPSFSRRVGRSLALRYPRPSSTVSAPIAHPAPRRRPRWGDQISHRKSTPQGEPLERFERGRRRLRRPGTQQEPPPPAATSAVDIQFYNYTPVALAHLIGRQCYYYYHHYPC